MIIESMYVVLTNVTVQNLIDFLIYLNVLHQLLVL
jgi:hypothetical protein